MGKVGTESPAFIEPIAMRKDGIQAMFSKQKQSQTKPKAEDDKSIVSKKRARSPSPVKPVKDEGEAPAKKTKREDVKQEDTKRDDVEPGPSQDRRPSPSKSSPRKKVCMFTQTLLRVLNDP